MTQAEVHDEQVCEIGGVDDGTLRVCCSTHGCVLCAHHYARTHFVETMPRWADGFACDEDASRGVGASSECPGPTRQPGASVPRETGAPPSEPLGPDASVQR